MLEQVQGRSREAQRRGQSADGALLARVARGEPRALGRLYDRHAARVYGHALVRLGSVDRAEALTLQVFLALWRHAACVQNGALGEWLAAAVEARASEPSAAPPEPAPPLPGISPVVEPPYDS